MSQSYRSRSSSSSKGSKRSSGGPRIVVLLVAVVLLVGVGAGIMYLVSLFSGDGLPVAGASATPGTQQGSIDSNSDKFYDGVFVDDIPLGGLTQSEAKAKIEARQQEFVNTAGVTVTKDATSVLLKISETNYTFDTADILDKAWKLGREGTDAERKAVINGLAASPQKLVTTVTADPAALEQKVRDMAAPYFKAAVDAVYAGFDLTKPVDQRITYTPEVPGEQVNADALWAAVKAEFANKTFGTVQMTVEPILPQVTVASLQADLQLLQLQNIPSYDGSGATVRKSINDANKNHTFTTRIKKTMAERMTNIRLASESVSGLVMPGLVFDFNVRTGLRDKAHGYKEAPVDIAGTEDIGIGGGVCQVSSTLYNAVIRYGGKYEADGKASTADRPGLAVIERDNHSVPSGYVMKGMDATVDMQLPSGKSNKNLRFRNDFSKPVLVVLYYEKIGSSWYEHCDIYGPPLTENGVSVSCDLVGKNFRSLPFDPLATPGVRYSDHAKQGNPVLKSGGNGFTIDMYVVKTISGQTPVSTKIYSDRCDPQPPYWYIYSGEAMPTPTPSPTATPDATLPPPTAKPTATPTEIPAEPPAG